MAEEAHHVFGQEGGALPAAFTHVWQRAEVFARHKLASAPGTGLSCDDALIMLGLMRPVDHMAVSGQPEEMAPTTCGDRRMIIREHYQGTLTEDIMREKDQGSSSEAPTTCGDRRMITIEEHHQAT